MSLEEQFPGMKPGVRTWDVAVGAAYLFVLLALLVAALLEDPDADADGEASDPAGEASAVATDDGETQTVADTPTPAPTIDEVTATPAIETPEQRVSGDDYAALLQTFLRSEDIDVDEVSVSGRTATIDYTTAKTDEGELAGEIGGIAGAYAVLVDDGWDVDPLDANIHAADRRVTRTFYVESAWAQQFAGGEMEDDEFAANVISTLEVRD